MLLVRTGEEMKQLLSFDFQFVQTIEPKKDIEGRIFEYSPQSLYDGKETSKLNAFGDGTFCKFSITDNPNIDLIREYIQKLILKAKARGYHELILQSGKIHKALSMKNAMPSVCRAMHSIPIPCEYVVIRQSPSGKSSRLIIKYLF
jgi:hypothetical protein